MRAKIRPIWLNRLRYRQSLRQSPMRPVRVPEPSVWQRLRRWLTR